MNGKFVILWKNSYYWCMIFDSYVDMFVEIDIIGFVMKCIECDFCFFVNLFFGLMDVECVGVI